MNEKYGFIGEGTYTNFVLNPTIFRTTDGGLSWQPTTTPQNVSGHITSIYMIDSLTGYASIYASKSILWKTVDGGVTWTNVPQTSANPISYANCVFPVVNGLVVTAWDPTGQFYGGISYDGGATVTSVFKFGKGNFSNGIDFSTPQIGIVTMRQASDEPLAECWYTNDGGLSWNKGAQLDESWSVYAIKGTQTFFSLPEGEKGSKNSQLFTSTDAGSHWNAITTSGLPGATFTGHITGFGSRLYVQTEFDQKIADRGLYRSDDFGLTWKSVGGPSNERDTRFCVVGCNGETVFAFDDFGGVYKTTDGGDGTIAGGSLNGDPLSLTYNTISIATHYCQPTTFTFPVFNQSCTLLTIDTVILVDTTGDFSLLHSPKLVTSSQNDSVVLSFHTDSNVSRKATVHIIGKSEGRSIDTILTIDAFHSRSPEPYLSHPTPTKVGDTVGVALRILPPTDSINIKHLAFHLSYNGDILTPVAGKMFEAQGTLSQRNKNFKGREVSPGNLDCSFDLDNDSITNKSDFSLPVIYIRFGVTLTTTMSCPIIIDSFSIAGTTPLSLCDIPSTTFEVVPQCGDSTISYFMRTGEIPQIISLRPNPASSNIEIDLKTAGRTFGDIQIVSALGVVVKQETRSGESMQQISIEISDLPSGVYYARIVLNDGTVVSKGFSVKR